MALPNFLCVGASKSGTTSLHYILSQHPDIFLPEKKEIHFFDDNNNFQKGISWYQQQFEKAGPEKLIGDISPDYMFYDYALARAADILGTDVKLILMLRNPIERAYSEYLYNVRRGFFEGSFEEAIQEEKKYDVLNFENRIFIQLYRSMYSVHISNLQKSFPNLNNIKYIIFEEDFLKNRQRTIDELFCFLSVNNVPVDLDQVFKKAYVPRFQAIENFVYKPNAIRRVLRNIIPTYTLRRKIKDQWLPKLNNNKKKKIEKLDPLLKKKLINTYFLEDIKKTESLINRDLSFWLQ